MNEEKLKIIYTALDSLDNNPLFKGMWKYVVNSGERIEIGLYIRDTSLKYIVEARRELRLQQLPRLMANTNIKNSIIIADRIYPDVKEQLVANSIAYIEGNGNVFIPQKELYIWVDTNKSKPNIKLSSGRAFTKTGLKVLFHFLLKEALLNMPYRQIAELTQTSPGNITNIMNSLRELNFLSTDSEGKLKLNNKKQMLDKWIDQYEHELKPAIEIGTFRFEAEGDYQNWRRTPLETKKTLWGGEPAGHLMTGLLKPRTLTIYSLENRNDLVNNYRMVRDPDGYIKVYRKFWNYDGRQGTIAPAILVYADLLHTGDVKNVEAADRIFDDVIKPALG
ncbi:MAG: hypothetical protein K8F30_11695 [Taibaiella sp.]|nr:hypothetical protein [Taibaiella sp.]